MAGRHERRALERIIGEGMVKVEEYERFEKIEKWEKLEKTEKKEEERRDGSMMMIKGEVGSFKRESRLIGKNRSIKKEEYKAEVSVSIKNSQTIKD